MRPSHGFCPLESSQSITPRPKISDFFPRLYGSPLKHNGSLYATVPSPFDVDMTCFTTLDKPKSVILAMSDLIRILAETLAIYLISPWYICNITVMSLWHYGRLL